MAGSGRLRRFRIGHGGHVAHAALSRAAVERDARAGWTHGARQRCRGVAGGGRAALSVEYAAVCAGCDLSGLERESRRIRHYAVADMAYSMRVVWRGEGGSLR